MNNSELNQKIRKELHLTKNFPSELKQERKYVCYVAQYHKEKEGKIDKIPTDPLTPTPKSINHLDPVNWVTFDEAYQNVEKSRHLAGIAYVLSETDKIYCIDFDQCLNDVGEVENKDIKEILEILPTYTEISVSKEGLHLFGIGSTEKANKSRYKLCEIYNDKRFIAITGNVFVDGIMNDNQDTLDQAIDIIEENKETEMNNNQNNETPDILRNVSTDTASVREQISSISDEEKRVASAVKMTDEIQELEDDFVKMGSKERENETWSNRAYVLYTRGWHPLVRNQYQSQSEADWALCTFLAWLTDCDKEGMEAIFNNSELGKRDKWKFNKTYRDICIREAINANSNYIKESNRKNWPALKEERYRTSENRNSIEDILRQCGFQSSIDNKQHYPDMNAIVYGGLPCPSGIESHVGEIAYFYPTTAVKNVPKSFFKCSDKDCSYHKNHDIYAYVDFLEENFNV